MQPRNNRLWLLIAVVLAAGMLLTSVAGAQELTCLPSDPPTGCAVVTLNPVGLTGDFYLGEVLVSTSQPAAAISVPAGTQKINVRNIQSTESGFGSLFVYNDATASVSVAANQIRPYTVRPTKKYIRGSLLLTCDIRNAVGAAVQCQVNIDGIPQPDLLAAGAKGTYILDPGSHSVVVTLVGDQAAMWSPDSKTLTTSITASAYPRALTATFNKKALVTITLSVPTAVADLYVDGALVATQVATHQLYVAPGSHKFEARNVVDPAANGVYRWKDATTTSYLSANTTRTVKITLQKEFLLGFLSVTCQLTGLKSGQTGHCLPSIDGTALPQIENGKSATFNLTPGTHELSVDVGPDAVWGNAPQVKSVSIRAGQTTRHTARIAVVSVNDPSARHTNDLPDDIAGQQVHVMYVLPSDGVDRSLDINGTLRTSVGAFQKWLAGQTGGRNLRLDTYGGEMDITFFRMSRTNAELESHGAYVRDQIERELEANGLEQPNKIYAVYYDGTSTWACGGGAWPPVLPGSVGAMYLKGLPNSPYPCANNPFAGSVNQMGYMEFAMLHEIMHTIGIVPQCAPNHTLAGHVSDSNNDLMYAGPLPWNVTGLDIGNNDYYNHGNPGCLDLATSGWLTP